MSAKRKKPRGSKPAPARSDEVIELYEIRHPGCRPLYVPAKEWVFVRAVQAIVNHPTETLALALAVLATVWGLRELRR